jgi:archaemetzincin
LHISGIVFGLVAVMNTIRLLFRRQATNHQRAIALRLSVGGLIIAAGPCFCAIWPREQGSSLVRAAEFVNDDNAYSDLERKLRPLADRLPAPRPGDWLAEHREPGQTIAEYLESKPVRKSEKLHTIYLCLVGDFTEAQQRLLNLTKNYLALFFDCPVKVNRQIALAAIPPRARRTHPTSGDRQLLTSYILHEVLEPERPADALAYLALTASDLWPGKGWNFVFGLASLRERTGVWSIYRNGDPAADFLLCLRRTLGTASHETGHILGMRHCTAYSCLMNGSNHQEESDRTPMHLCPVCLRKLCWNLGIKPIPYLTVLKKFCRQNNLNTEAGWYEKAINELIK